MRTSPIAIGLNPDWLKGGMTFLNQLHSKQNKSFCFQHSIGSCSILDKTNLRDCAIITNKKKGAGDCHKGNQNNDKKYNKITNQWVLIQQN